MSVMTVLVVIVGAWLTGALSILLAAITMPPPRDEIAARERALGYAVLATLVAFATGLLTTGLIWLLS